MLNTSRTSIPSVLRNVGRSGQESGDFVMSGNCEIETNCNTGGAIPKYFSIPTGGVACSRRNRKRAAPPDLHPKSLSKKKRSCYVTRLASLFTFVKPTLHFLCRFSPKVYTGGIIRSPSIFLEPERLLYFFNNFVSRFYFLGLNHASSISSASVCGSGSRNARAATSDSQIASFHARR